MITGAVVSGATELRVDDIHISTTKQSGSRAEAQETTAVCAHLRRCHKGARRLARAPVRRTPPTSRAGGSPTLCRARQRFFWNLHPKMIKNTPGDCRLLPDYYFDCRLQSDSQINAQPHTGRVPLVSLVPLGFKTRSKRRLVSLAFPTPPRSRRDSMAP